jgi:hypothetical protein
MTRTAAWLPVACFAVIAVVGVTFLQRRPVWLAVDAATVVVAALAANAIVRRQVSWMHWVAGAGFTLNGLFALANSAATTQLLVSLGSGVRGVAMPLAPELAVPLGIIAVCALTEVVAGLVLIFHPSVRTYVADTGSAAMPGPSA